MKRLSLLALACGLAGCATFSPDAGFSTVQQVAKERLEREVRQVRSDADGDAVRAEVERRLQQPLSADDAVQIALLNNPGLQATYFDLDVADADLVQASRLPNPRWAYLHAVNGAASTIESIFTAEVMELLTLPLRSRMEARRFEQAKLAVTDAILRVAFEARKAYFEAVAAEQSVRYLSQVREAAEAGAELGVRMAQVGNWSKLSQMREQAFYADATAQYATSRQVATMAREKLTRTLGLWGENVKFALPPRLPELPLAVLAFSDIEARAVADRLDIQVAKADLEGLTASLGLNRATRFVNVLELGPARVRETPEPTKRGYELTISIPLFDWGEARVAKAEAVYMQAVNRMAKIAIDARSEVRQAHFNYLAALEIAKHHRDEIVPLRKKIADENVLRYNGMLISVFELLADAREQVRAVNAAIEAARDFWLADADLRHAMGGRLPSTGNKDSAPAPLTSWAAPARPVAESTSSDAVQQGH